MGRIVWGGCADLYDEGCESDRSCTLSADRRIVPMSELVENGSKPVVIGILGAFPFFGYHQHSYLALKKPFRVPSSSTRSCYKKLVSRPRSL